MSADQKEQSESVRVRMAQSCTSLRRSRSAEKPWAKGNESDWLANIREIRRGSATGGAFVCNTLYWTHYTLFVYCGKGSEKYGEPKGSAKANRDKKLSYCCDSRSYCVQKYDRLKQLLRDTLSILTPSLYSLWSQCLDLWIKMLIQAL